MPTVYKRSSRGLARSGHLSETFEGRMTPSPNVGHAYPYLSGLNKLEWKYFASFCSFIRCNFIIY